MSETFCILPWIHLFADERGVLFPCCRVVDTQLPNVDAEGVPYRIDRPQGLAEAWNSGYMKDLRRSMLEGGRPEPCSRCYMYEDLGIESHRQGQNRKYAHLMSGTVAETAADGSAPLHIRTIDIRLGNLCNLRCRMCFPNASKALIDEWGSLYGLAPDHPFLRQLRDIDWFERDEFWSVFERFTPSIERLHFAGGEPLLIPQMFDFLERLAESGRSERIVLSYNTNLTVLPQRLFTLWPRFREVRVTVSLDGFDTVNSFIRHPSKWDRLDHNLRTLDAEAERLGCTVLGFNTTVQVYNVLRLTEMLDYTLTAFTRFEPYPNLSLLAHPPCLSIQVLPPALKEEAARRLRRWVEERRGRWPEKSGGAARERFLRNIEGVISHMQQADRREEIPELLRRNAIQDRWRGQDVLRVLPELAPLFQETAR